ncbi:MAG: type II toxin-antitoxin system VapC family toxin [Bifidobacteriaceae bacterium]|jgi:predicted nucleic acid-binding protein|nr:type II toxin-antitoxin system VapC family toxin [Bifidobacteriaceae bacterium]
MSGAAVVDASVVIAWQDAGHPRHREAKDLLEAWGPDFAMHKLNLAEVLVGLDESDWSPFIELLRQVGFQFQSTGPEQLARARQQTGLKMPDACSLALSRAKRATALLSFDQRLTAAAQADGLATG